MWNIAKPISTWWVNINMLSINHTINLHNIATTYSIFKHIKPRHDTLNGLILKMQTFQANFLRPHYILTEEKSLLVEGCQVCLRAPLAGCSDCSLSAPWYNSSILCMVTPRFPGSGLKWIYTLNIKFNKFRLKPILLDFTSFGMTRNNSN